ncbi:MAG: M56 family metallopeptidase, partial [Vicinamibacterales bacterium]
MTFPELPLEGIAVAEAAAKATVVLAAAGFVSFVLRRSSAALRHLVWTLALCSAIALPVFSLALPKWQLPILRLETHPPALAAPAAPLDDDRAAGARMAPSRARATRNDVAATTNTTTAAAVTAPSWTRTITWPQAIIGLWLLGAALVFARVLVGLAAVQWLSRRTEDVRDAPWLPMARDMASQLGITSRLRFLRSGRASMPVAAGVFRPAVIMPADADTWRESRLRIVLLHELAHVKRRDCLTHLLAQTACALHWFNPLAWVAARRARTERERACDDLVLAAGTRRSEYADQLLEIARAMRGDRFPGLIGGASLAMAHQSQLEGRLIAILDPKVPRLTRVRARLATVVCFCAVAPLGALQPWSVAPAAEVSPAPPAADVELTAPAPAIRQARP